MTSAGDGAGEGLAARWFGVRVEYEKLPPWREFRPWQFVLYFATFGTTFGHHEADRFWDVLVVRRDTAAAVKIFRCDSFRTAEDRTWSLRDGLEQTSVAEFCQELGIPLEAASGQGQDLDGRVVAEWVEIKRDQRRSMVGGSC